MQFPSPNVTVEQMKLLLYIWDVLGLNPVPESSYPNWGSFFSFSQFVQMPQLYQKLWHDCFLVHPFQFIIH
jgi:hypothetical protein